MPIPYTPTNFTVQQGNGEVLLNWAVAAGATSYKIYRSLDSLTYSLIATVTDIQYLDASVTKGTEYWYQVASLNVDGESVATAPVAVVPVQSGEMSLLDIRNQAKDRADRKNSNFLTLAEWNLNINQSWFELYDLLITTYEDYFLAPVYTFQTVGGTNFYDLPRDFYKMYGVDLGLNTNQNAFVTLEKFNFISRNQFVYPQLQTTVLGPFNLKYRVLAERIEFIPVPTSGQFIRVWYVPKPVTLLKDSDVLKGVSGWAEYVIVDAAIKALQKEESPVDVLMLQKEQLKKRILSTAANRDQGQPDKISDTRNTRTRWGDASYGWGGNTGGY